ncbi:unnamed protein product [Paramecium primaurelia]|uniref:AMMECR1 domain-containing protein n=2 Tax=Paramecium TaxID=5884 RepID=A0A8S1TYE9_9CILI|nr:unnamed protein product [Paramecium primaurelia]CAD8158831.1 unnamed protein product [Paramecium pentaurelia]
MQINQALPIHCAYCFDVLIASLQQKDVPKPTFQEFDVPVFVTFHANKEDLRGCIGTFSPGPLGQQLAKYTFLSAFKDSRFPPIQTKELNSLDVGVSLLINFQKGKKWNQWEVGKHGIIIDFQEGGREYGATFLPEVAAEQEWDINTTLEHLIAKAGYRKNYQNVLDKIDLTTYETSKAKLTYAEYLELKK